MSAKKPISSQNSNKSAQAKRAEPAQLPSLDQAVDTLSGLFQEAYFRKLAAYGIVPTTPQEAYDLLRIGRDLSWADYMQKTANVSRFGEVADALESTVPGQEFQKVAADQERDVALAHAASALAGYPDVYKSILALKLAQARWLNEQNNS